ncbi:hypothetical protein ACWGKQ_46130 [Streptomyces sp. NPDC054770]
MNDPHTGRTAEEDQVRDHEWCPLCRMWATGYPEHAQREHTLADELRGSIERMPADDLADLADVVFGMRVTASPTHDDQLDDVINLVIDAQERHHH